MTTWAYINGIPTRREASSGGPAYPRAVKVRSGHIVFDRKVTFKQLLPVFRTMFLKFLEETQQTPEDPEILDVLLEENLRDLRRGRKPEGYNRDGAMRLLFPITEKRIEMYVYSKTRTTDVPRIVEMISRMLQKAKLKHAVEWDKLTLYQERRAT